MSAVTLTPFHLVVSPEVSSVELIGSWDNFSSAYPLQQDTAKGRGQWRGTFKFDRIVCDGRSVEWNKPRSGLLKQGGRYWYFFRLDDHEEYFDPAVPYTCECPLLPGQCINVLDVPVEVGLYSQVAMDGTTTMAPPDEIFMTHDPEDRTKKIRKVRSSFLSRPKSLFNLLKPRSSGHAHPTAVPTAQQSPVHATPFETVFESPEPNANEASSGNDIWPLNCAPANMLTSGAPITTSIDKPLPEPEKQIRAKPSLRRMASGFLKLRSKTATTPIVPDSQQVSPVRVEPLPTLPLPLPQAPVTTDMKEEADEGPSVAEPVRELRRTVSVRNFARPFQALSIGPSSKEALRRSKSHAVLDTQVEESFSPPMPVAFNFPIPQQSFEPSNSTQSPAAASAICSPTFSSGTVSDTGFGTPNRFSAQYAIVSTHSDDETDPKDQQPKMFDSPMADRHESDSQATEHIPRTWITDLTSSPDVKRPEPGRTHTYYEHDDYDDYDDENDVFYSVYDQRRQDYDDEDDPDFDPAEKQERERAIAALRSTLMADPILVSESNTVGSVTLGDLGYLRNAIV